MGQEKDVLLCFFFSFRRCLESVRDGDEEEEEEEEEGGGGEEEGGKLSLRKEEDENLGKGKCFQLLDSLGGVLE